MISVIIPTYNEESVIETTLRTLFDRVDEAEVEILVSDGESTDQTVELVEKYARVISGARGRSKQLNRAAEQARGDILFFLHADALLPAGALSQMVRHLTVEQYDGGGFSNTFSSDNRKIKLLGRIMNLRLRDNDHARNTLFFGDNGIFVKKSVFEALKGFRDIPIMEDYDFSVRMMERYRVVRILEPRLVVSSRRHRKAGFVKTRLQWMLIKRLYQVGVSPSVLAQWYADVR